MRRLLAIALMLVLSGCQPLPHPLADDMPGPRAPILTLRDTASIAVAPVAGIAPDARDKFSEAVAQALQDANILASTQDAGRNSLSLLGTAREPGDGGKGVTVDWRLVDPGGRTVGQASGTAPVALAAINRGDAGALKALATASAPPIAKLLQDDSPASPAAAADQASLRQIVVWPVTGAPGDGKDALKLAMAAALTQAKLKVMTGEGDGNSLAVVGNVALAAPQDGRQHVSITWALLQPDGQQLGVVTQENAVPQGSLNGRWGEIANAVARAAAPGILALIEKAEQVKSGS
jgi:hypothetical protein